MIFSMWAIWSARVLLFTWMKLTLKFFTEFSLSLVMSRSSLQGHPLPIQWALWCLRPPSAFLPGSSASWRSIMSCFLPVTLFQWCTFFRSSPVAAFMHEGGIQRQWWWTRWWSSRAEKQISYTKKQELLSLRLSFHVKEKPPLAAVNSLIEVTGSQIFP